MAREPGSTLGQAKQIAIAGTGTILQETIGKRDRKDIYQFRQTVRSNFNLRFSKLKPDASLTLFNQRGKVIARSKRSKRSNQPINLTLDSGIYYVQVSAHSRRVSRYQLRLFSRPVLPNALNADLRLAQGETIVLSPDLLRLVSLGQSAGERVYTLTRLPEAGRLTLEGRTLQVNQQFTQEDIDKGRLSYTNTVKTRQLNQRNVRNFNRSETTIVWEEFDGNDYEIYLYDDLTNSVTQISNNEIDDELEIVADAGTVWQSVNGDISTLFFYDRLQKRTIQLATDNITDITDSISNRVQSVSDVGVVWSRGRFLDLGQLFFYNSATNQTIQLTDEGTFETVTQARIFWQTGSFLEETEQLLFYDVARARTVAISGIGSNRFESISDATVVWKDGTLFGENQLFLYRFATETNTALTDLGRHGIVRAEKTRIVWQRSDGNDNELFLYDQSTGLTTPITNNDLSDSVEGWLDNGLVWSSFSFPDRKEQLFFYDFSTQLSRPFTEPGINDFQTTSDANIFWSSFDGVDTELFVYNSKTAAKLQLTENGTYNKLGSLFNSAANANAVWEAFDGRDNEIFFFDGSRNAIRQLTENQFDDVDVKIANTFVAWQQFDGIDEEILWYNVASNITTQLTQNLTNDFFEAFWNSKLFWRNKDGLYLGSFVQSDRFEFKVSDQSGELVVATLNISLVM